MRIIKTLWGRILARSVFCAAPGGEEREPRQSYSLSGELALTVRPELVEPIVEPARQLRQHFLELTGDLLIGGLCDRDHLTVYFRGWDGDRHACALCAEYPRVWRRRSRRKTKPASALAKGLDQNMLNAARTSATRRRWPENAVDSPANQRHVAEIWGHIFGTSESVQLNSGCADGDAFVGSRLLFTDFKHSRVSADRGIAVSPRLVAKSCGRPDPLPARPPH